MISFLGTSKNAAMLLSGSILRMLTTFIFIFYAANHLGVEGFGKYSIVVHFFELFVNLIASSAAILLTRDAARWLRHRDSLLSAASVLVCLLALLAPLVLLPMAWMFQYSKETLFGLGISSLAFVPASIAVLCEAVFVASQKSQYVTAGAAVEGLTRVTLSMAALMLDYGILTLSLIIVVSRTVTLLGYLWVLRCRLEFNWKFNIRAFSRFVNRWRIFALENWMAVIYTSLDMVLLSWLAGETAAGLYSAAWRYVRLGALVARSFTSAVFPTMTRLHGRAEQAFVKVFSMTLRVMFLVTLPVIALVSISPARFVELAYSADYLETAPVLQILIWMLLLEFINPFLSHVLFSQGRQTYCMYVAAFGLLSNLLLMPILIIQLGPTGAAYACVCTGTLVAASYLSFAVGFRGFPLVLSNLSRIGAASIFMGLVAYLLSDYPWWLTVIAAFCTYILALPLVGAVRYSDISEIRQQIFRRAIA